MLSQARASYACLPRPLALRLTPPPRPAQHLPSWRDRLRVQPHRFPPAKPLRSRRTSTVPSTARSEHHAPPASRTCQLDANFTIGASRGPVRRRPRHAGALVGLAASCAAFSSFCRCCSRCSAWRRFHRNFCSLRFLVRETLLPHPFVGAPFSSRACSASRSRPRRLQAARGALGLAASAPLPLAFPCSAARASSRASPRLLPPSVAGADSFSHHRRPLAQSSASPPLF